MSKRLAITTIVSCVFITLGMTTGCALLNSGLNQSDSTPQNPEQTEAPQSTPIVDERSDTEQVIDTVLSFIILSSENKNKDIFEREGDEWDYWYGGYEFYSQFAFGEDDDESAPEGFIILEHLRNCYEQEEDGKVEYYLPTIQDNYAAFVITLDRDNGIFVRENTFRFNLKKDREIGWGITDIRLIHTEEDRTKIYIPD